MKITYKKILEDIFSEKAWNHYSSRNFVQFPLHSEKESQHFIKSFINLSGKAGTSLHNQIDKLGSRSIHVVSAFLLGHYLYENTNLKAKIDKEIKELLRPLNIQSNVNFSFMWFLICLFHDIGYVIENQKHIEHMTIEALLSKNGKMPEVAGVPKFYNTIYKNYFEYRIAEHRKNDHGITVAPIMYNELCNIREKAESARRNEPTSLSWEKDLEQIYAFCAWNILAHNIWFMKKNEHSGKLYAKYKIKRLLLNDGEYKVKADKHPFFFLFCLVDSIEPYKTVPDIDSLDKIEMEITGDKLIITSRLKCNCGKQILKRAEDLRIWLTDTTQIDNKIEISLNQKLL